ncbi:MAG: MiaB/RimO family radical SAM methylthiotransferase [Chloroflexi bacterium]|nr:MiaB/RimO family radical SAM methylthiotransferase [Chloroflexota bacterium]
MPGYYIWTVGCQMNKADSGRLASYLDGQGYEACAREQDADLVVVNSCVVRHSAEARVVSKLRSLAGLKKIKPGLTLALTGCLVDSKPDDLKRSFPHVDMFFKPQVLPDLGGQAQDRPLPLKDGSVTAFVPVIQGCNNFCSYCIVPYRRGREQSRPVAEVRCEVEALVERGVKEVTLLGQNVDSYGHDLPGGPGLADLLAELNDIAGLERIRFLTSHPEDMTPRLVLSVARLSKVCEHINLPLQSGDDRILESMRRGYTADQYRQLVAEIRGAIPGAALSTDVIVGFPGETEAQFQHTFDILADIRFDTVHVAMYSPRPGTLAARELADDVPFAEKQRRRDLVEAMQTQVAAQLNSKLLGQTAEVLVEARKSGKWQGRTRTNKLVFFMDQGDLRGRLVPVKITQAGPWSLQGVVL